MQFLLGQILHPNLYNLNIYGINLLNIDINRSKSVEDEVDDSLDDEELDDPLNADDDFMEFWETMEIKTQKKKD